MIKIMINSDATSANFYNFIFTKYNNILIIDKLIINKYLRIFNLYIIY